MNAAVKILAGATPVRAPDPPAPVFVPVPAPELAHDFYNPDREGVLVCAKAQQSGCTSAGMAQRHWWASKKQCAVCCQCREDYGMTTGSPQTLRTIRQAVDAPLEVSDETLTSFLCAPKRQHVFGVGNSTPPTRLPWTTLAADMPTAFTAIDILHRWSARIETEWGSFPSVQTRELCWRAVTTSAPASLARSRRGHPDRFRRRAFQFAFGSLPLILFSYRLV